MAPKVPKRKAEEVEEPKAKEQKVEDEPKKEEAKEEAKVEEKFQEPDAKKDSRSTITENIHFETADTTLNVVQTLGGKLLTSVTEGGMSCFLSGARANVAQKAGRYMFEAKVVQKVESQQQGKQGSMAIRIGFSVAGSSLLLGDDGSVCFDAEGFFHGEKKKQVLKGSSRIGSHQVVAVVLNLDSKSPNFNTVALYKDGVAIGSPMALPDNLKDKPLFPQVTFRNASVAVNFGPTAWKELPFKCRLLQGAASSDCSVAPSKEPKDGKFEVVVPIGFPDEGTFDWLDGYLEKNPHFVEISDRAIAQWAHASGIHSKGRNQSNDKPDLSFGLPGQDGTGASFRKVLNAVAPLVPRNYLVMEVKSNLVAAERQEVLKRFNYPCYKKVAAVVMGEPGKEYKANVQNKLLKDKQAKADQAWKAKKADVLRKKAVAQKQKELAKVRKENEKKRKAAAAAKEKEKKAKEAAEKGEEPPEDEPVEEEKEEEEAEEKEDEEDTEPPLVELTDDEKSMFFAKKSTPDLAPQVMNASYAKFTTPDEDEGFDDIRYEWSKESKAKDYLKKWVMEKKLTTRIDNIKPGKGFIEKSAEFEKVLKGWQSKLTAFKSAGKKAAKKGEDDEDIDIFSVTDVSDVGGGVPLFEHFSPEDWELVKLRFEFGVLFWAFKQDADDADRVGIPMDHLSFYYNRYFRKAVNNKAYGASDTKELFSLIKDTVGTKDNVVVSQLEDLDTLDIFVKLTEEQRRERSRRIEAGDETARLKFSAPKPAAAAPAPTPAAKAEPAAAKLGATAAPKAIAQKLGATAAPKASIAGTPAPKATSTPIQQKGAGKKKW